MSRKSWASWLAGGKTDEKQERKGPYTIMKDGPFRARRWRDLVAGRSKLEEAASQLRTSSDMFCLMAAELVDAAIERVDEGMANLHNNKPRNKPSDKYDD